MNKEQEVLTSRLHTIVGDDYFPRGEQLSMWAGYGINKREVVAMARELIARRSSDEQAEVVGYVDRLSEPTRISPTEQPGLEMPVFASPAVAGGVTEAQVEAAARVLVPVWYGGFEDQTQNNAGGGWLWPPGTPNKLARDTARAALTAALAVGDEGIREAPDACPVCAVTFKPDDMCQTDIEMGTCHAACLEGSPLVDLETGEPMPEGSEWPAPYRYDSLIPTPPSRGEGV